MSDDTRGKNEDGKLLLQGVSIPEGHRIVERFIPPEEFDAWGRRGKELGFLSVASGPFVRSSYHAKKHVADAPAVAREAG